MCGDLAVFEHTLTLRLAAVSRKRDRVLAGRRAGALRTHVPVNPASPGYYGWNVNCLGAPTDVAGLEDKFENLYYEDTDGGLQGPFSGAQMYEWFKQDYMPLDMAVR